MKRKISRVFAVFTALSLLSGCGGGLVLPYQADKTVGVGTVSLAPFFAADLCVSAESVPKDGVSVREGTCAGLFNVSKAETVFAQNIYERVNPASLTKVMTALVALENGDLTRTIVASSNVTITEKGAQKIGIREGDRMTLDQALHILLMYSANDVAVMIAEGVGGTVERFSSMMNDRAVSLGATGCHFANPHGLTDKNHYVTAYDLYLIFHEAMQYKEFQDIINASHYSSSYHRADGSEMPVDIKTTNGFLNGSLTVPDGVTVVGGKTGTTAAAGHCLILLAKNRKGEEYIAVVLRTPDSDTLGKEMTLLLRNMND